MWNDCRYWRDFSCFYESLLIRRWDRDLANSKQYLGAQMNFMKFSEGEALKGRSDVAFVMG
jgi:hypothetical protein